MASRMNKKYLPCLLSVCAANYICSILLLGQFLVLNFNEMLLHEDFVSDNQTFVFYHNLDTYI